MDGELGKWFATLGVGGALAGLMFFFYRKDMQRHADDIRGYTDQWRDVATLLMGVVRENTASNTKLITVIELMDRRQDARRRGDPPPPGQQGSL